MGRNLLWASLALTPVALVVRYAFDAGDTAVFVLAALALVPLAWLVGEATEHVAEHTGPGIGGFVNASFGNAPELIIALFAIADGLPNVVRGSIAGSVVSNLLLVLGLAVVVGGDRPLDRRSLLLQLGLILAALILFLAPSVPGWHGNPDRHALFVVSLPIAAALLALYLATTLANLRVHADAQRAAPSKHAWPLRVGLGVLGAATVATAFVSELLVHSLDTFGRALGLSQFFVSVVIVAIVGNAAEHGGSVVVARRGNMRLASEIAVSSTAQVAVFVTPAIVLVSCLVGRGLPLSFRAVELATMALATVAVAAVAVRGRSQRWHGVTLMGAYVAVAVWYGLAGDR
ncbi:MAG: calcium/proton exchanger [Actinobacteria bacterium]|nr:calcium/proton exchanger [Actinomycetota bacterium]MBV8395885.1 calcium/proton exchanger [Actinomycetota bacterium]MBV8599547.1 calcium/proton exchanger [Actinomycetota bacterium]